MAYTIPSGYTYYDASAKKTYTAGQSFSGAPAQGDSLSSTDSSVRPSYYYEAASTGNPAGGYIVSDIPQYSFTISAGFRSYESSSFTATTITYLDQIAGLNVVYLMVPQSVVTINHLSNHAEYISCGARTKLQTISGTMPSTLKTFNARDCSALRTVPSFANCSSWKYGFGTFENCINLISAPQLPEGLEIMDSIFEGCSALTTAANIPSTVIRARYAYRNCTNLLMAPINNSNILTTLIHCFDGCTNMTTAENFVIKGDEGLDASYIFQNCVALQVGPQSITAGSLSYGFYNCESLENSNNTLEIIKATNLAYTFYNCKSLTETPSLLNVIASSLSYTFCGCSALTTITDFPPQINDTLLSCVSTFENCSSLQVLPVLPNYIGSMVSMFKNCVSLIPQNIYIPYYVTSLNTCFSNAINLSGIITLNRTLGAINNTFKDVNGPIIITGDNNLTNNDVLTAGNNVYKELNVNPTQVQAIRCSDTSGTLDDNGQYIHLIIDFESVVVSDTSLYVPKVYLGNDQQEPIVDWRLTNNNTHITDTIENSTSVQVDRVLAGDLITSGTFETYLNIGENEVLNYKIYIPSSADDVYDWDSSTSQVVANTKYWNGIAGSAIFTSSTFIFDATPDGKSFKIGGPIDDSTETGFIVGNAGLPQADQFPSTFNGPVTINEPTIINSSLALENYTHELRTIFNLFYPKGSYYETHLPYTINGHSYDDDNLTNNEIALCGETWFDPRIAWGGTWVLETEGQVHVSAGANYIVAGALTDTTDGGSPYIQEHTHGFTQPKIPNHQHSMGNIWSNGSGSSSAYTMDSKRKLMTRSTSTDGGGGACTGGAVGAVSGATTGDAGNMPPYIVVYRWHRTA